ncbi:MAG: response regulator [Isosphaera sp.]|nr:response regulator [Isosphaera sp.]
MSSPGRDGEPIEILLVEDEPVHADLTMEALAEGKILNRVAHVRDGVEAMAYLRREGKYADAPRPDLILLDLNMPRKDGREVLEEVKADPALRRIPVVMLTSSSDEKDVLGVYDRHVNCYIVKPVDFEQFSRAVLSIEHFWLTIVKLPAA